MRAMAFPVFVFLGLILLLSAGVTESAEYSTDMDTTVVRDVRQGAAFTFQIHPGLPLRTFKLLADAQSDTIAKIEIYLPNAKMPSQVLAAGQGEPPYRGSDYFKLVDIDFDGFQDIGLLNWWGATGNEGWHFWRFDPASQKFVDAPEVSALGRPEFDAKTQTIRSFGKGGWCTYTTETYRYDQHKLHRISGNRCQPPSQEKPGDAECVCEPF